MNSQEEIDKQINELTLEEKAKLLYGNGFWATHAVERLGITAITMSDGPHGLRRQEGDVDNIGFQKSLPATCFPTASALGSSFDTDLLYQLGEVLAAECKDQNVDILLGPGINIKRSPLCGRNFEYFSEDPYLSGMLASAFIKGIQKNGVGTCVKHFAANSQEKNRLLSNSVLDERTLHEIYLKAFAIAIEQANPYSIMSSYNMLNGEYASENFELLETILRKKFLYQGVVLSDWGAVNDSIKSYNNGLNIEMPGTDASKLKALTKAIRKNHIRTDMIDKRLQEILLLHKKIEVGREIKLKCDYDANADFARVLSENSCVLLKNENNILPIDFADVLIIGEFANHPRYQGEGSSNINPYRLDNLLQVLDEHKIVYRYAQGYSTKEEKTNISLAEQAVALAKKHKKVIVLLGLPESFESEGFDRENLDLPQSQISLMEKLTKVHKNLIVVLQIGSPITLPFVHDVSAILLQYLSGSSGAHALYNILSGEVNPSGHLAETFPLALDTTPVQNFPTAAQNIYYTEGEYIGYRYYEAFEKQVLFPFGFGLSYSTFNYNNFLIDAEKNITLDVENTSDRSGKTVVQIYVSFRDKNRTYKSLQSFQKIEVAALQKKKISFEINKHFFSFYDTDQKTFVEGKGNFTIEIATSAHDILYSKQLFIDGEKNYQIPDFPVQLKTYKEKVFNKKGNYTRNSTLNDISTCFLGRIVVKRVRNMADKVIAKDPSAKNLIEKLIEETPLRMFAQFSDGKVNDKMISILLALLNGNYRKAIKNFFLL